MNIFPMKSHRDSRSRIRKHSATSCSKELCRYRFPFNPWPTGQAIRNFNGLACRPRVKRTIDHLKMVVSYFRTIPNAADAGRGARPVLTKFRSDRTLVPPVPSSIFAARLPSALAMLVIVLTGVAKADSNVATVASKTSNTTVQVAEPFTLELTVTASTGSKVDFPSIGKSLGNFDVTDQVDRADVPSENETYQRIWTRRLTLESIVTGDIEIPSLEIQVRWDAKVQTLKSAAIPIRVASVLEDRADPTKFRDIQSVVDITVPEPVSHAWPWWTLGGFVAIAAAWMLVAVAKRKTWISPNEWALRELDQLRQSEAMRSSDSERVTENLTSILRDYLELQFDIASPMQTTHELLQGIEIHKLMNIEMTTGFAALFENADLARFAGLHLSSAELMRTIDDAQRLIEQTTNQLQKPTQDGSPDPS